THVLKTVGDLDLMFTKHHALLRISTMTPDMLRCWLAEQPMPPVTSCIVRFGRQLDGAFVSGNLAFQGDKLMTHEEAGVCIVPSYFQEGVVPLPKCDYPYNIVIPHCHVRYLVGHLFYNCLMPKLFLNNTMQAKAVFAAGIMGLYASNLQMRHMYGEMIAMVITYMITLNNAGLKSTHRVGFSLRPTSKLGITPN
ncbi:MAG: hypothetical protein SGPRY_003583, partial [Prymnesium sp.]